MQDELTRPDLVRQLPGRLRERVRLLNDKAQPDRPGYVLYWMHHAVRGHENPALDTAIWVGNVLSLPVLVYQGLAGAHRFNSDRHHTFIMEGARDVQQELKARGIRYAFYLGIDPELRSPLYELATRAAIVVAEDFPAPPFPAWMQSIAEHIASPLWAVDAHCVVPMQQVGKAYNRAYAFRNATKNEYTHRLTEPWTVISPEAPPFSGELPFADVDLWGADLAELCARCTIDHSVGPVPHTRGGSVAGYSRWETFKAHGLHSYHKLRNNAAISPPKGVSRLSPYLHHGHVSPFRIAREAHIDGSDGAAKFLDELLIWRELAYTLCFYRDDLESMDILPRWASETLEEHAGDSREGHYSWETLARGKTGNVLWDAAQKSLLAHGELHNNVRMTWGKAFLAWTRRPEEALRMMIDLNHRYALDGSDPNSYGGLLWCLGQFDRPFEPERPIFGRVRTRPIDRHTARLDLDKYVAYVHRSPRADSLRIAVIGAGMSGLVAARTLADHGIEVRLFEKSRGPGGRMASRREENLTLDHGAQYFTARDERFRRYVDSWKQDGLVDEWKGRIGVARAGTLEEKPGGDVRYVGAPRMSALTRHLAVDLDVSYGIRVAETRWAPLGWTLESTEHEALGRFDGLIVTTPPEQALPFLAQAPALSEQVEHVVMLPCWAAMVRFAEPIALPFDGLFINEGPLSWASRNNSKPGRAPEEAWILHGSPSWSRTHLEDDAERVAVQLLAAFFEATGIDPVEPAGVQTHRWRYALADNPIQAGCLWDGDLRLAVCGDWCNQSRVEGAFLSGIAAAGRIMGIPDRVTDPSVGRQLSVLDV